MLEHQQLNLFNMRSHEFTDTNNSSASNKLNKFLKRHNQGHCKFMAKPIDVKYAKSGNYQHSILLLYIPENPKK